MNNVQIFEEINGLFHYFKYSFYEFIFEVVEYKFLKSYVSYFEYSGLQDDKILVIITAVRANENFQRR